VNDALRRRTAHVVGLSTAEPRQSLHYLSNDIQPHPRRQQQSRRRNQPGTVADEITTDEHNFYI
jgi:hypothetical protein